MNFSKSLVIISSCLFCSEYLAVKADTIEKTTTRTITVETVPNTLSNSQIVHNSQATQAATIVLPAEVSYLVVDPKSGIAVGNYDVVTRQLEGGQSLSVGALIVEKNSGHLVATIDATGRVVDVYTAPATETLSATIIERKDRLSQMINEAYTTGMLSKEQVATMHAQLDRIAAETAASSPQLSLGKAMIIGYNLDLLTDYLVPIVHTTQPIMPVMPAKFVEIGGRLALVDDLTYRQIALEKRIDDEYKAGRLAAHDVSSLKTRLDQIATMASKWKSSDGRLSSSEKQKLAMRLDQVQTSLDGDVSHVNKKRSQIGLIVD